MIGQRKMPYVAQLGNMDCGIACLTMLFNYYGCKLDIVDVGADIFIGRDGMSLSTMKKVTEKFGFKFGAYRYSHDQDNLNSKLPVILCSDSHYIVVEKIKKNGKYSILDPAKGREVVDFSELKSKYKDILVCITPGNIIVSNERRVKIDFLANKSWLLLVGVLMLLVQAITLCVPVIVQYVIDEISSNKKVDYYKIIAIIFLIIVSYFVLSWLRQAILLNINTSLFKSMVSNMIGKLFKVDTNFFEWHAAGEIGNRFNNISQLNEIITNGFMNIIIQVITSAVCLLAMIHSSIKLTLFTIVLASIQIVVMIMLNKKNRARTMLYIQKQGILQKELIDTLKSIVEIKCMGMDKDVHENLLNCYADLIYSSKKRTRMGNLMSCFESTISLVFPLIIYIYGSYSVSNGSMTIGTLIAFVTLVGYFTLPFNSLVLILPSINGVKEIALRYKELMKFRESKNEGMDIDENFKNLKMHNVSYSYTSLHENALDDIFFEISHGERVAIIGKSGSGKSTLIKAILSTIQIDCGEIYINDINTDKISKSQIYNWFSIVTQNPMCLNSTIRKNVDVAGKFSDEQLWKALELAEIKEDIANMPLGLNTMLGDNGQNISGGQRQRLAIARALLSDTEVIIFDEATSNLDPITEKKIYDNLKKINKTQIIITHRLVSIYEADKIYVLNEGKILEHGTHDSLLKNKGWYFECVNSNT